MVSSLQDVRPYSAHTSAFDRHSMHWELMHLDSLDVLSLVELLSGRSGQRIDETHYPKIAKLVSAVAFLSGDRS